MINYDNYFMIIKKARFDSYFIGHERITNTGYSFLWTNSVYKCRNVFLCLIVILN